MMSFGCKRDSLTRWPFTEAEAARHFLRSRVQSLRHGNLGGIGNFSAIHDDLMKTVFSPFWDGLAALKITRWMDWILVAKATWI
jgi:hypothetical protein